MCRPKGNSSKPAIDTTRTTQNRQQLLLPLRPSVRCARVHYIQDAVFSSNYRPYGTGRQLLEGEKKTRGILNTQYAVPAREYIQVDGGKTSKRKKKKKRAHRIVTAMPKSRGCRPNAIFRHSSHRRYGSSITSTLPIK